MFIQVLASIGFALSFYGYYVEQQVEKNPSYKAACDISDQVSCTKAFKSPYGKLFGISNTLVGMVFYALIFVLAMLGFQQLVKYLAMAGAAAAVLFAYLLYVKVKSYCLVCTLTYVVNLLLLITTLL